MIRERKNMIFGSRGQTVLDMMYVLIILVVLGLAAVFGAKIFGDLNTEIQADDDMDVHAKAAASTVNTNYAGWFDNAFVMVLVLLWVLLLVTSFMINSHPVFFVVTVILLLFVFVVGMVMSNTYQDVTADDDLSASAALFPKINFVMGNFLIILIVMGLTAGLALYAKNRI